MKQENNVWIRHGDVVLEKVESMKGEIKKAKTAILAEGEVTGHFHKLSGNLLISEFEGDKFVECKHEALLTHQEHNTLTIPKGVYKIKLQREVDLLGEVRQVMD